MKRNSFLRLRAQSFWTAKKKCMKCNNKTMKKVQLRACLDYVTMCPYVKILSQRITRGKKPTYAVPTYHSRFCHKCYCNQTVTGLKFHSVKSTLKEMSHITLSQTAKKAIWHDNISDVHYFTVMLLLPPIITCDDIKKVTKSTELYVHL